jgi:hypothetical protein
VVAAVEPRPGGRVGEPEVGAAVDDHGRRVGGAQQRRDVAGLAVREREEHDVVAAQGVDAGLDEHPPGERHQVRLERAELLAGVRGTGERADLDPGVREQEPKQLSSGIPTGSGDRDLRAPHAHDYTHVRMFM